MVPHERNVVIMNTKKLSAALLMTALALSACSTDDKDDTPGGGSGFGGSTPTATTTATVEPTVEPSATATVEPSVEPSGSTFTAAQGALAVKTLKKYVRAQQDIEPNKNEWPGYDSDTVLALTCEGTDLYNTTKTSLDPATRRPSDLTWYEQAKEANLRIKVDAKTSSGSILLNDYIYASVQYRLWRVSDQTSDEGILSEWKTETARMEPRGDGFCVAATGVEQPQSP